MFYLFVILFSLSLRSPNVTPNPTDYEVTYGGKTDSTELIYLYERENGVKYRGIYFLNDSDIYKNFGIKEKYYYKEAKNIHYSEINPYFGFKYLFLSADLGMTFLKDRIIQQDKRLLTVKLGTGALILNYKTNLSEYNMFIMEYANQLSKNSVLKLCYQNVNDVKFWQTKIEFQFGM